MLAIAALGADRMFLLPGPSSASAGLLSDKEGEASVVDIHALGTLAERLVGLCMSDDPPIRLSAGESDTPDPFLSPWVSSHADTAAANPKQLVAQSSPRADDALPELTGIVSANGRGYGVLDGKPLRIGASRDGYTLLELSNQSAKIMKDGSIHTLPLRR